MKLNNITIGADPELFIINRLSKKVVSAVELIPGEKGNPYRAEDMPEGFGLETDNILAEFNIPPVNNKKDFINNIVFMQDYINSFVRNINPCLEIKCAASRKVPDSELQSEQAKEFGCSIDYNVYTQSANEKPDGTKTNLRSAGGHLHCGYDNPNIDTSVTLIKYFDAYLGIPSVIKDPDKKRRSLYGKAGCFRLCPYGFEYRTLSSAMMSTKYKLGFIWDQLTKAFNAFENDLELPSSDLVQEAINNSNVELAKELIVKYKLI